ncbi:replicative DNA helicase [Guggenheimella bovis]
MAVQPKVLPYNIDAEQSLLGAMILSKEAIANVIGSLKPSDFFKESHQIIYEQIEKLTVGTETIDAIVLADSLKDIGKLQAIGGQEYLEELLVAGSLTYNAQEYARIIREKSVRRRLISACDSIKETAYFSEGNDNVLELAEELIFDISERRDQEGLRSVKKDLVFVQNQIAENAKNPDAIRGLSTGFIDLDKKTHGLQKSDLVLIAGRPSMGKSVLMMNIAQKVAQRGKHVCVFSLEMDRTSLIYRMLATETRIPLQNIMNFKLFDEDWKKLALAYKVIGNFNLSIDDTPAITVQALRSKLRRYRMENGALDLVLIDYLQLMDGGGGENRQVEISSISRGLKMIAREMGCPVVACSQLSRGPEQRTDKRPMLSDLRESGAIEQDADLVMLLYRDEYYNPESEEKGVAEVIIAKQRNGETGKVKLAWLGETTTFDNLLYENKRD